MAMTPCDGQIEHGVREIEPVNGWRNWEPTGQTRFACKAHGVTIEGPHEHVADLIKQHLRALTPAAERPAWL
ncbi:hypothetical protein [Actinomadura sp. HBU206391]|uniref:hypothetical protein n=1 Tax=Actinomadura sp. HBU206391 TaxID=2731692 RepID=UPI00164EDEF2|nr:hypothetical protein [Actinomadura sp. HBU206391]MBC6458407.1 hypothetical protein [Actinomadura sp. HBU206391]